MGLKFIGLLVVAGLIAAGLFWLFENISIKPKSKDDTNENE